jgi:hypothetical protein
MSILTTTLHLIYANVSFIFFNNCTTNVGSYKLYDIAYLFFFCDRWIQAITGGRIPNRKQFA